MIHRAWLGRLWREPLAQFLAIGALLFLVFSWRGGPSGSSRIVITPGQLDTMAATFERTWQRPPSERELKGLVDDYVREEIATREAMAMGLDRDDIAIRRRLRLKYEFVAAEASDSAPPSDAELEAWLRTHADAFRVDAEISFRQVFINADRRGPTADKDARAILAQLAAAGPSAPLDGIGDTFMLPQEMERASRTDIARQYGSGFAQDLVKVEPGRWAGPLQSGLGMHVVLVRERREGRLPALAEVRAQVEREFLADRRRRELDALYEQLLSRYTVTMDPLQPASAAAATPDAAQAPARGSGR
ncbi:hypothetical protein TBR22_A32770 [Luteitalea sp. TBR-22]|uniref:peptidylprolyl isomerase n=1 Tax=Luteitalea sp. TBR-22 TaxID=2802971 RepID=UPI001AFC2F6B|nr:peptidylprolyl isomerase [Luteitalea sp. TBR-22]BCS34048.1 hypothetical protein TBR22_A32770 [Luteitalea sp. TBR-22]